MIAGIISRRRLICDSFLVFINLSLCYNLIPYLLFGGIHRFLCTLAIVILNTIYTFVNFGGKFHIGNNLAIYLIVSLNITNMFSGYISNTGWQSGLVYTVLLLSFYMLLCSIYRDYLDNGFELSERLFYLFRGYFWLATINIVSCIILFILSTASLSIHTNNVSYSYDLFTANVENLGGTYFFPYHLCVVYVSPFDIRIPFFQDHGYILGFYHEPHTLTFMLYPALFMLLYFYKRMRYLIITAFIFISLLAGSTTNILCIILVLLVYILYLLRSDFKKSIAVLLFCLITVYLYFIFIDSPVLYSIFNRIDSTSSSYSQNIIEYAFTPKTLWGTNCFDTSEMTSLGNGEYKDVGWIKFVINLLFLCFMAMNGIRLFFSDNKLSLPVLLFMSYFFFHSSKVAMSSYSLTMLSFVCFVTYILIKKNEQI